MRILKSLERMLLKWQRTVSYTLGLKEISIPKLVSSSLNCSYYLFFAWVPYHRPGASYMVHWLPVNEYLPG